MCIRDSCSAAGEAEGVCGTYAGAGICRRSAGNWNRSVYEWILLKEKVRKGSDCVRILSGLLPYVPGDKKEPLLWKMNARLLCSGPLYEVMYDCFKFYKRFINVVRTMELKKSMKRLPTRGTMKNALGAAP